MATKKKGWTEAQREYAVKMQKLTGDGEEFKTVKVKAYTPYLAECEANEQNPGYMAVSSRSKGK